MKKIIICCTTASIAEKYLASVFFFSFHAFCLFPVFCFSQCPPVEQGTGTILLSEQRQVDDFDPECSNIASSLTISGSNITDLRALEGIETISGSLIIKYTGLENISFPMLSEVRAQVEFNGNNDLKNISVPNISNDLNLSFKITNNQELLSLEAPFQMNLKLPQKTGQLVKTINFANFRKNEAEELHIKIQDKSSINVFERRQNIGGIRAAL